MRQAPFLTCINFTFACMCCAAVVNSQPPTYRPHTPNAAYGLAVVSVMLLDTSLLALVMITAWQVGCCCVCYTSSTPGLWLSLALHHHCTHACCCCAAAAPITNKEAA